MSIDDLKHTVTHHKAEALQISLSVFLIAVSIFTASMLRYFKPGQGQFVAQDTFASEPGTFNDEFSSGPSTVYWKPFIANSSSTNSIDTSNYKARNFLSPTTMNAETGIDFAKQIYGDFTVSTLFLARSEGTTATTKAKSKAILEVKSASGSVRLVYYTTHNGTAYQYFVAMELVNPDGTVNPSVGSIQDTSTNKRAFFKLQRVGNTVTGSYNFDGSATFIKIYSYELPGDVALRLYNRADRIQNSSYANTYTYGYFYYIRTSIIIPSTTLPVSCTVEIVAKAKPAATLTPTQAPNPTPTPAGCITSTTAWQNKPFTTQTGTFTTTFYVIPLQNYADAVVGVSNAAVSDYPGMAAYVRFNPSGFLDVRNGSAFTAASSVPYSAGKRYDFRLVVRIPTHTYDAYVTPQGSAEITLGTNIAFRTDQNTVTSLANWAIRQISGPIQACNFSLLNSPTPTPTAITAPTRTPTPTQTQSATGCKVRFLEADRLYCNPNQTQVTVQAVVDAAPANSTLQKAWDIVLPADKATGTVYSYEPAVAGRTYSLTATWPGIRSTDTVVEIHFGLNVLDSQGNPVPNCTGSLDYYWYPWAQTQCSINPSSSSVPGNYREAEQITSVSNGANEVDSTYSATSTVWLGNGGSVTGSYTGLRFINVNIPKNAKITSAYLGVQPSATAWISMAMDMFGENSDNSTVFSSASRPSARPRTAAVVRHSSNVNWNKGTWYTLGDISPLVQAVVNRAGWASDNSLSVIMKGVGGQWGRKFIVNFDNTILAPRLVVTYTQ